MSLYLRASLILLWPNILALPGWWCSPTSPCRKRLNIGTILLEFTTDTMVIFVVYPCYQIIYVPPYHSVINFSSDLQRHGAIPIQTRSFQQDSTKLWKCLAVERYKYWSARALHIRNSCATSTCSLDDYRFQYESISGLWYAAKTDWGTFESMYYFTVKKIWATSLFWLIVVS